MPSTLLADHPVFNKTDINKIATDSMLVQRESKKFDPSCFLQALLDGVISGKASLSQLAFSLGQMVGKSMSKQALNKRFDDASSDFLMEVYSILVETHVVNSSRQFKGSIFGRILIEDSSFSRIHKGNAEYFKAHGNGKIDTAGFKINLTYDLLTSALESNTLRDTTEQDKTIGKELIERVRKNDLVMRDMGYFAMSELARIEQLEAFWMSRLPAYTGATATYKGEEIELEEVLKEAGLKTKKLELDASLGEAKHPCRIVAVRASRSAAKKARKERAKRSKLSGAALKKSAGWIRDGWHILVTNITEERVDSNTLMELYRMRWDIEIQFRAWKQSLNIRKALDRESSPHHIYALILASMIHLVLIMIARFYAQQHLKPGELSLEKLAVSLSQFIAKSRCFEECWNYVADLRHVRKDRRKRNNPVIERYRSLG